MDGDDLTNLGKNIDLFAEEVLNLLIREVLDVDVGRSARLLRGLFLFGRNLRAVIFVVEHIIRSVIAIVVVLV